MKKLKNLYALSFDRGDRSHISGFPFWVAKRGTGACGPGAGLPVRGFGILIGRGPGCLVPGESYEGIYFWAKFVLSFITKISWIPQGAVNLSAENLAKKSSESFYRSGGQDYHIISDNIPCLDISHVF
jgi:hypothetical protein